MIDLQNNLDLITSKTNELYSLLVENNIPIINKEDIIKHKDLVLGEGAFGTVYRGKYKDIDVAIKKLKLTSTSDINEILIEINSCTKINHKCIPKFYGIWKTDKYLHLIFDFINGTNLSHWVQLKNESLKIKINIAIQICDILENLHEVNVIHRDLKPENILIMDGVAYIIDFGVSKLAMHTETGTNFARGTPKYFGPENCTFDEEIQQVEDGRDDDGEYLKELDKKPVKQKNITISTKFDIWSLGCIICFMVTGIPPWTKRKKNGNKYVNEIIPDILVIKYLSKKTKFPIYKEVPNELKEILNNCFIYNPQERISAKDLKLKLIAYYNTLSD